MDLLWESGDYIVNDIANAAVYLASDVSAFVTGINLPVDGGNSIGF